MKIFTLLLATTLTIFSYAAPLKAAQGMDIYSSAAPAAPSAPQSDDTATTLGPATGTPPAPITGVPYGKAPSAQDTNTTPAQTSPPYVVSAPAPLSAAPKGTSGNTTATSLGNTAPSTSTATRLSPITQNTGQNAGQDTVQEKTLPPSPLPTRPLAPPKAADAAPAQPTAEEIAEQARLAALKKAEEDRIRLAEALAREQARIDQTYTDAAKAYAQGEHKEAFTLWSSLSEEAHAPSMTALGLLFDRGEGVLLNSKQAVTWFRKAAESGDKDGMYHLGRMLVQGRGGAQHLDTAATWLRKAADLNQHEAQYLLAVLYERGEGVIQNDTEAAAWYSLAAAGHNVEAQARLGHLYRIGKGVPKNHERATLLLYGATMAGHAEAQKELFAMSQEEHKEKGFPKVTLFGALMSGEEGLSRAAMRSALSVSKVKALREDTKFICDVYDLKGSVPGAHQMAVCYGAGSPALPKKDSSPQAQQEMGFLKIDYAAPSASTAKAVQNMVEKRFGKPSAGEEGQGYLWNLGHVIVATQYIPEKKEVGLMYMIPRVYHTTQKTQ